MNGKLNQAGDAIDIQFLNDIITVCIYCSRADKQLLSDLATGHAFCHKFQDFFFSVRKQSKNAIILVGLLIEKGKCYITTKPDFAGATLSMALLRSSREVFFKQKSPLLLLPLLLLSRICPAAS